MSSTPSGVVDLRSDTVTRPTPEMRRAMAEAEVGDDAYGDHLAGEGVLAGTIAPGVLRMVTHHDVDDEGVARACKALAGAP